MGLIRDDARFFFLDLGLGIGLGDSPDYFP